MSMMKIEKLSCRHIVVNRYVRASDYSDGDEKEDDNEDNGNDVDDSDEDEYAAGENQRVKRRDACLCSRNVRRQVSGGGQMLFPFLLIVLIFNTNNRLDKQARHFMSGVGGLLGNYGGAPAGNHGQHDRGGDLQGQADILHKVNILPNSLHNILCNNPHNILQNIQYSIHGLQILSILICSSTFLAGCLTSPVRTCTQWG